MAPLLLLWASSLILTSLLSFVSAADTDTCYNHDGTRASGLFPCYPGAKGSSCCASGDFCMSNGLCLDADGDQFMTIQGCTDPDPTACSNGKICADDTFSSGVLALVWVCAPNYNRGKMRYCCGNVDCCKGKDVRERDIATAVFRPPQAPSASASTSSTAASSSTNQSAHDENNINDSSYNNNNNNGGGGNNNTHALAIGLGVGIPMGLALLGSIVFLGLQIRKRASSTGQPEASTMGSGGFTPQVIQEGKPHSIFSQEQQPMYPSELNDREPQELYGNLR
ncbi:hypothetical protein PG984_009776 [Apiospora sp. TS-2023a]